MMNRRKCRTRNQAVRRSRLAKTRPEVLSQVQTFRRRGKNRTLPRLRRNYPVRSRTNCRRRVSDAASATSRHDVVAEQK